MPTQEGVMTFGVKQVFFMKHKHLGESGLCSRGKILIRRLLEMEYGSFPDQYIRFAFMYISWVN